jgi:hypothetical protein
LSLINFSFNIVILSFHIFTAAIAEHLQIYVVVSDSLGRPWAFGVVPLFVVLHFFTRPTKTRWVFINPVHVARGHWFKQFGKKFTLNIFHISRSNLFSTSPC